MEETQDGGAGEEAQDGGAGEETQDGGAGEGTPGGAQGGRTVGPATSDLVALGIAYFTVGVTVSVAVTGIGTPVWLTLVVALTAYSATAELAFVAVIATGGSLPAALVSGWLAASRFGLLSTSLGVRLRTSAPERALAALSTIDPSVALALAQDRPDRVRAVYWRVSAWLLAGYVLGSIVGVVVGNVIGDPRTWGLDAVFPAALLAILAASLRRCDGATSAAVGAVLALVLVPHAPGGVPILVGALGAVVGLAAPPRRWREARS